jgi:hypothetical protein
MMARGCGTWWHGSRVATEQRASELAAGDRVRSAGGGQLDAMAGRQAIADDRDGVAGAFRGGTDIDDQRIECSDPQVVGLPPRRLALQVGIDAGSDHGRGPDREFGLSMLSLCSGPSLGEVARPDVRELDRMFTRRAGIADCVRCEVEQYLTRKRVVLRMQWLQSPREVVDFRGRDP